MTKIRSTDGSGIEDARGSGGKRAGLAMDFPGGYRSPTRIGIGHSGGLAGGALVSGGVLCVFAMLSLLTMPLIFDRAASHTMNSSSTSPTSRPGLCESDLEQIVCGAVNDLQSYWGDALPTYFGVQYAQAKTRIIDEWPPSSLCVPPLQPEPFYCAREGLVYIGLENLQQIEETYIGSTSDLAEQFIIAHEYGHHVQNLLGTRATWKAAQAKKKKGSKEYNQYAVASELQADCYAGVWVGDANRRGLLDSPDEILEAIRATEGLGVDRVHPSSDSEQWTFGSAEQRSTWFLKGFRDIDPTKCDTFGDVT